MNSIKRKSVRTRQIGTLRMGPIYLVRIVYADGRVSRGVSDPGGLLLDQNRDTRHHFARKMMQLFGKK